MPLPVPNLDDRTFEQLVAEGRSLIPRYSQSWTNHNPSDPGITLLELLAWLTETAIFQVNQLPAASLERFMKLVDVCRVGPSGQPDSLDQALGRTLATIEAINRAVTAEEFQALARQAAEQAETRLARTAFVLYRDTLCDPEGDPAQAPLAALVVVVPDQPDTPTPRPTTALTDAIFHRLISHCLLTTRLHVVGPEYVEVRVTTKVVRKQGSGLTPGEIEQSIRDFLHPIRGGFEGQGWPFGRTVYYSEMLQRLESLPPVDHVETLALSRPKQDPVAGEGLELGLAHALVFAGEVAVEVTD
jgi:hypothetical protein